MLLRYPGMLQETQISQLQWTERTTLHISSVTSPHPLYNQNFLSLLPVLDLVAPQSTARYHTLRPRKENTPHDSGEGVVWYADRLPRSAICSNRWVSWKASAFGSHYVYMPMEAGGLLLVW
jgi:hypothetical protein